MSPTSPFIIDSPDEGKMRGYVPIPSETYLALTTETSVNTTG
jgi:hypothetical protein